MDTGVRRDMGAPEDNLHNSSIYGVAFPYPRRVGYVRRVGAYLCHRLPETRRFVDNRTTPD